MTTQTPIQSPFGERSAAEEVAAGIDLAGRRAIVTGASSGIGAETARVLADRGAAVTLAVHDTDAGASVAAGVRGSTGNGAVDVRPLELAEPDSIGAFIDDWNGPLDILINDAAVMAIPERTLTPRGVELHFATNHLCHFALTTGLYDALRSSGDGRVVSLSSSAHLYCPVPFDDPVFAFVPYSPFLGYGQSKTANVLFAVEANRRWGATPSLSTLSCREGSRRGFSATSIRRRSRGRDARPARAPSSRRSSRAPPHRSSPPSRRCSMGSAVAISRTATRPTSFRRVPIRTVGMASRPTHST